MYVHVGGDVMVPRARVIAIVNLAILDISPETHQFFDRMRALDKVEGDLKHAKSMVILENGIYLSSISATTLARRGMRSLLPESAR